MKRTGNERRSRTEQTARAWDLLMDLLVSFLPILGMVQNLLRKILQKWILVTAIYILQKGRGKHDRLRKMSRPVRYLSAILFFLFFLLLLIKITFVIYLRRYCRHNWKSLCSILFKEIFWFEWLAYMVQIQKSRVAILRILLESKWWLNQFYNQQKFNFQIFYIFFDIKNLMGDQNPYKHHTITFQPLTVN